MQWNIAEGYNIAYQDDDMGSVAVAESMKQVPLFLPQSATEALLPQIDAAASCTFRYVFSIATGPPHALSLLACGACIMATVHSNIDGQIHSLHDSFDQADFDSSTGLVCCCSVRTSSRCTLAVHAVYNVL